MPKSVRTVFNFILTFLIDDLKIKNTSVFPREILFEITCQEFLHTRHKEITWTEVIETRTVQVHIFTENFAAM